MKASHKQVEACLDSSGLDGGDVIEILGLLYPPFKVKSQSRTVFLACCGRNYYVSHRGDSSIVVEVLEVPLYVRTEAVLERILERFNESVGLQIDWSLL